MTVEAAQPFGYDRPEHVAAAARDVPTNPKMRRRVIGQDPLDVPEKRLQALFGNRAVPGYLERRWQPVGVEILRDRLSARAKPGLHHRNPRARMSVGVPQDAHDLVEGAGGQVTALLE